MTLVTLGQRPSLHAAARKMEGLPVSMAALYDKLRRTEPAVMRGLVRGSAQRLAPAAQEIAAREPAGLAVAHCRWQPLAGQREALGAATRATRGGAAGA